MRKLVLFDVDKTLTVGTAGHRAAFSEAFKKVLNIDATIDVIDYDGKTDTQIINEVVKKFGIDPEIAKSHINEITRVMTETFEKTLENDEIRALDGVFELLDDLGKHSALIGIVTGNLEPIARGKLKKVGILKYFQLGAFGNEDSQRSNLIKLAIKRAEDHFNFQTDGDVYIIGDTPRDIAAGKEAGTRTIGVATGKYSLDELQEAGADYVLENLTDTEALLKIICS